MADETRVAAWRAWPESTANGRPLHLAEGSALDDEVPESTDAAALLRRLVAAGDVTRFERIEPSLRDIYLRATASAA